MPKLNGSDFIAEAQIFRPEGNVMVLIADVGQPCDQVPSADLERLERRGKIRRFELQKKARKP